ncbi:MAG: PAS domain S-box protein [Candidatus Omnitrophica bacterium]|nr:PAS domain S-box protein [Candidatus Omnitrophota bacterium]
MGSKRINKSSLPRREKILQRQTKKPYQTTIEFPDETFQDVVRNWHDPILITNEKGKPFFANKSACKLLGYSQKEILNITAKDIIAHDKFSEVNALLKKRMRGEKAPFCYETVLRRKDQTAFIAEITAQTVPWKGVIADMIVLRDITDSKKQEEQSRLFKFCMDSSVVSTFLMSPQGAFLDVNKQACLSLGYTKKELTSMSVWDIDPGHPKKIRRGRWNIFRKQKRMTFETNHRRKDGIIFPVEVTNHYLDYQGKEYEFAFAVDITARKKAEKTFRDIEWIVKKRFKVNKNKSYQPFYDDITKLNRTGLIINSVNKKNLRDIAAGILYLLDSSIAIYELNGNYALRMFNSQWCRALDQASRKLAKIKDNKAALLKGKWLCHDCWWKDNAKICISSKKPFSTVCVGGIHLYSVPILAKNEVVGVIIISYGDPPKDPEKLQALADKFRVNIYELMETSRQYESRPQFLIDIAKEKIRSSARLIGTIVETNLAPKKR